jgi:hypothetical protein
VRTTPDHDSGLGPLYLRSLLRVNLSISLTYFGLFSMLMLVPAVVFWFFPAVAQVRIGPVPLGWILPLFVLGPALVLLGARYVRSVEVAEAEYTELIDEP